MPRGADPDYSYVHLWDEGNHVSMQISVSWGRESNNGRTQDTFSALCINYGLCL